MSGKQHKREAKRARQAAREAQRRRERQRTIQTIIVIAIAMAIGGVLIFVSLGNPQDELASADESAEETPDDDRAVDPCEPAQAPENAVESKPTFPDGPDEVLDDGLNYRAVIETSCGDLVFQLLEDDSPQTVNSFVFLAEQGFFDGLEIFRNATGISALQTGAGDNSNTWDIGYTVPDELSRAQTFGYTPGALAMANAGPDTGGSQFFMVYGDSELPPDYTVFGQLLEGLDILESIGAIPTEDPANPANDTPSVAVYLERVAIEAEPGEPAGPLAPVETLGTTDDGAEPAPAEDGPAPASEPEPTPSS
jgi:peptidyl-prolyl cis-trans isomerase B (cyclophilin B)